MNQNRWEELRAAQSGIVTRRQARACGINDRMIAVRISRGRWQRLHHGVYATFSGEVTEAGRLWAAVLRAGPDAVLSHQTAADLWGIGDQRSRAIHVTVPRGSPVSPIAKVVLHYSARVSEARHPALGPPRTTVEETVLDLTQTAATVDEALGWIFRACGSRRTTPGRIESALRQRHRARWRADLTAALQLAATGVHSLLEHRWVTRVERPHGLPRGRRQRPIQHGSRRQYTDVSYDAYDTLVELDGRVAHPDGERRNDARRDNANLADGRATLRYGWIDANGLACRTAAEVARVLSRRGWTGRLRSCGSHCTATERPEQP